MSGGPITMVKDGAGSEGHGVRSAVVALESSVGKWGRVLIAEDDEPVRRFLCDCLRRAGYLCDGVGTAAEATEALASHAYDLLLTDINLPDSATLAYLEVHRSREPSVPVIVITGYPSLETAIEAVRLSVADYLVKPLDERLLVEAVGTAIGKGRLLRVLRRVREDMHAWGAAMDRLERSLLSGEGLSGGAASAAMVEHLRAQATQLLGLVAESLRAALEGSRRAGLGHRPTDLCLAIHCPRRIRYEGALQRAVDVLAKTKTTFKSRDLGELRRALVETLGPGAGA